jgi:hypothetical protein
LELTSALSAENDYITLTALANALKFLDLMLRHEEEFYESYRAHVLSILHTVYDQVITIRLHFSIFCKMCIKLIYFVTDV